MLSITRRVGERIYAHIPGEGEDAYEQSLIGTDLSGEVEERLKGMRAATHVANRMLGLVMLGSPALGLAYGPTGNEIIHNLSTALIDPRGRLVRLEAGASGRSWKPAELFKAICDASPAETE